MTLILALLERHFVVQASDRLVSFNTSPTTVTPFDTGANKSIVFQARDARVLIGYSGASYVGDWHTDEWSAYQLAGKSLPRGARFPGTHRFRIDSWPDLSTGLRRLCDGLTAARARGEIARAYPPGFLVAGWQAGQAGRRKRRVRACVLWEERLGRYIVAHQAPRRDRLEAGVAAIPGGWMSDEDFDELFRSLAQTPGVANAEESLAQLIRHKAATNPAIGRDCLTVRLDDAQPKCVKVRFLPHPANPKPRAISTPVIVWPGTIIYPRLVKGRATSFKLDDVAIEFDAVPSDDPVISLEIGYPPRRGRPR